VNCLHTASKFKKKNIVDLNLEASHEGSKWACEETRKTTAEIFRSFVLSRAFFKAKEREKFIAHTRMID
jgi:hypothetical protein